MAKYIVDKGFCFDEKTGTRKKGSIVDISGDELKFAQEKKCVTKYTEKKDKE